MSAKVGLKIKHFREKAGISQSHLAEILNVSPQAVSKWETGSAYPDIMLIPMIADHFNISCDALLTDNGKSEREYINKLLSDVGGMGTMSREEYFERINALEDAIERFPRSYSIMLRLAYMYSTGTMYQEYEERGYQRKIIDYCERVYTHSEILREKYDAITLLCYMYNGVNNKRIIELAQQMPEIHQTKYALIYHGYEGERKYEGMHKYFTELLGTAQAMLAVLIGDNSETEEMFEKIRRHSENRTLWVNNRENSGKTN